jgi:hypothetical protein
VGNDFKQIGSFLYGDHVVAFLGSVGNERSQSYTISIKVF